MLLAVRSYCILNSKFVSRLLLFVLCVFCCWVFLLVFSGVFFVCVCVGGGGGGGGVT